MSFQALSPRSTSQLTFRTPSLGYSSLRGALGGGGGGRRDSRDSRGSLGGSRRSGLGLSRCVEVSTIGSIGGSNTFAYWAFGDDFIKRSIHVADRSF